MRFYWWMDNTKDSYSIVERLKAGEREAYRSLFLLYYPSVLSFVRGFTKDSSIAEDIAQDVFMKIWIYRSSLDEDKPIRNYLFLLSRRQLCSWFRKKVTLQKYIIELSEEELENIIDEYESEDANELMSLAMEIIGKMPEKRRCAFILSRSKGLPSDEIAKQMGISRRTVDKHLELALRTLRNGLKEKYQ